MSKIHKLIIWHVAVLLLATSFWRYIDYIFNVLTPDSFRFDIEPLGIISFLALIGITVLGLMLFSDKIFVLTIGLCLVLPFMLYFGFTWINLLGVVIAILMLMDSKRAVTEDSKERVKINPRTMLRRGMAQIVMATFILISFAAFESPLADKLAQTERLPSAGLSIVRNIAESFVARQLGSDVSESQRQQIINELSIKTDTQLSSWIRLYSSYIPPALSFALFLILWSVHWIFVWLGVGFGMLIFWLLKYVNFVKIEEYDIKAERLVV